MRSTLRSSGGGSFRLLQALIFCLLVLFVLTTRSAAQCTAPATSNVTTWHNDNCRTGWQQSEGTLTQSNVTPANNSFGLLFQWRDQVAGHILAQPLAATFTQSVGSCQGSQASPCSLVFAATEQDMLYAFNATPKYFSQTPVWSINLASQVQSSGLAGYYVDCTQSNAPSFFMACTGKDPLTGEPSPFSGTTIGVTGTPAIDMKATPDPILYVVGAVCFDAAPPCNNKSDTAGYYLFAVDIVTGKVLTSTEINGSVPGYSPGYNGPSSCTSTYPHSGSITFNPNSNTNANLQRSALLLLNVNGTNTVYAAFADLPEWYNGWLFGYQLQGQPGSYSLNQTAILATTPYGTGGGIWGSGAGPASDGTYIYLATANGTLFDPTSGPPVDMGDTLLKLVPGAYPPGLSVVDWWAPSNVLNYEGPDGPGLCINDMDVASGGVLLVPYPYQYNGFNVVIDADKQSNIYVANQAKLGGFNPAGGNNIETVLTPCVYTNGPGGECQPQPLSQGYWASPAYWADGPDLINWLYYSATINQGKYPPSTVGPEPLNAYQLQQTGNAGPITSATPSYTSSPTLFCDYSPTPSVSSKGSGSASAGTGILWAIEGDQNTQNQGTGTQNCSGGPSQTCPPTCPNFIYHAALHAFCATGGPTGSPCAAGPLTEIYTTRPGFQSTSLGRAHGFRVPTVSNGQVYVGTDAELNVFGLCSTNVNNQGKCVN